MLKTIIIRPQVRALITAFIFLTRLPMPKLDEISPEDSGRALPMFPWVGFVIGAIVSLCAWGLHFVLPPAINAALVLIVWVLCSGGLHIDGLADSADGWLSGAQGDKLLAIMKDPRCGSAAVMIVGLMLIAKISALSYLIEQQQFMPLLLAPLIGRAAPLLLFLTTSTVNPTGLAQYFIEHASRNALKVSALLTLLVAFIFSGATGALVTLVTCAIVLWGLRKLMLVRLGGHTGDTLGASIEVIEATLLIASCMVFFNAL